jgi:hypothetical protein
MPTVRGQPGSTSPDRRHPGVDSHLVRQRTQPQAFAGDVAARPRTGDAGSLLEDGRCHSSIVQTGVALIQRRGGRMRVHTCAVFGFVLAAAVKLTVVTVENLTVGSAVSCRLRA